MAQELRCAGCNKYCGEVRDAKLRNGLVVYCKECDDANKLTLQLLRASKDKSSPYSDDTMNVMDALFGGAFGKR